MRVFKKKLLLRNQPWIINKRRRRERSCRDDRCQVDNIHRDLTLEILSRLPPKSILRFRCVSKLWYSITTLPSFINSFTSRSTSRIMVTLSSKSAKHVLFFPTHQIPDGSFYSPLDSYEVTNLDWKNSRSESIHGLILTPTLEIWNPILRRFLALPHPPSKHSSSQGWWSFFGWSSYLGYDPLEGKHKVLCVLSTKYSDDPLILTLGGQETWRTITKGRCPMHRPTGEYGRCFNGILYYRARLLGDGYDIIMSFDVKSENFNIIKFPEDRACQLHMIPYEGRVALVTQSNSIAEPLKRVLSILF
ncbi:unnamed protein product [Eruca vesicaria subsp. sativa]|uniref:F-box domain-containing protein n=1 Tax=Eruca vesicaria subsp. sativa TaxID=29727 RepID=A0ABC8JY22_ERUVS|nr:unnamed protein product [Eruca vesicaria subsp. sativa]